MDLINITSQEDIEKRIKGNINGQYNIDLKGCHIKCDFNFSGEITYLDFSNSIFEKNVQFDNATILFNALFVGTEFKEGFSILGCHFNSKVRFHKTKFNGICDFSNAKFEDLVDFWKAEFYRNIIFLKTDFWGTTVFSLTKFHENVLFTYTTFKQVVIFQGTYFLKGLDISLAILIGGVEIFDIRIQDYKEQMDAKDDDEYEYYVTVIGVITRRNKRETFRILKKLLRIQNNHIDSLKYQHYENETYYKQLEERKKNYREIRDYFILLLNRLSNNHGESWVKGALFTFGIGFLFFYPTLISTKNYYMSIDSNFCSAFKDGVGYYFQFLLPTHGVDFLGKETPSYATYIWDFVGRIFVSYGIYQTIQAFRKYKEK